MKGRKSREYHPLFFLYVPCLVQCLCIRCRSFIPKTGFLLHYRMGLLLFLVGLSDEDYIDISPETSYILRTREGEYHLYFDGEFFTVIPESELSVSPHDELKIYKE